MPMRPREGRCHSCTWPPGTRGIALMFDVSDLHVFVLPVRIFRMLQIPEGTAAVDHRIGREVIDGRR